MGAPSALWAGNQAAARLAHLVGVADERWLSYSDIAAMLSEEFGHRYSKNAVIAKAARMKLSKRPADAAPHVIEARKNKRMLRATQRHVAGPRAPRATAVPQTAPTGFRCSILDLDSTRCRWPSEDHEVGEPGFDFCGAPAFEDCPYCEFHWLRSIAPRRVAQGVAID